MMTATQNTGAARAWSPQMLQAWKDTKPLIISRLNRKGGHVQDADDVHQNTWLAAHAALGAYDPTRGDFGAWLRGIASLEVSRHCRSQGLLSRNADRFILNSCTGVAATLLLIEEDIAEGIVEETGDYTHLQQVLTILASVTGSEEHLVRTLNVILAFDGNINAAARTLGCSARTLRDSQAHTVRLAQVISRALGRCEMKTAEEIVTVEDLLHCLPEGQELPAAFDVLASMIAGGSDLDHGVIATLGESLGLSEHTSHVYYVQVVKMLGVAKYVFEMHARDSGLLL